MQWQDVTEYLRADAELELRHTGEVQPLVVAFGAGRGLFIAASRPFPRGGYAPPLAELLKLAAAMGADQVALSLGARAWSLADPVAPVTEDADLRQRVLVVHTADGRDGDVQVAARLYPYDLAGVEGGYAVRWHEVVDPGHGDGWIQRAMIAAVHRAEVRASDREVRDQLRRCARRGHRIGVDAELAASLGVASGVQQGRR